MLQLAVSVAVEEDKDKLDNVGAQLDVRSGFGSPFQCIYGAGDGNNVPQ